MLTSGELALLAPAFGFLGVLAGAWVTTASARRQQRFEAFQRRYDQRVEVYENTIAGMQKSTFNVHRLLATGEKTPAPAQEADRAQELWNARVRLVCPDDVRDALDEWAEVYSRVVFLADVPAERIEAARLEHLSDLGKAGLKATRAMAADLKKLSALSPRKQR